MKMLLHRSVIFYMPRRQRGLSLIVVLIALLIISLAAVALLRSSDTGTLVTGNVAFQKSALAAGDGGSEVAIAWLSANAAGGTLFVDNAANPSNGYYATTADACDLTGTRTPNNAADDVFWVLADGDPGNGCSMTARTLPDGTAGVPAGYTVRYVINRVCNTTGDPNSVLGAGGTPMTCSRLGAGTSEGSTRGGASYGNMPLTGESQQYYRITTRIDGPRNTVRYIQALVVI
jgi:type IV pilus assembly protein PilX